MNPARRPANCGSPSATGSMSVFSSIVQRSAGTASAMSPSSFCPWFYPVNAFINFKMNILLKYFSHFILKFKHLLFSYIDIDGQLARDNTEFILKTAWWEKAIDFIRIKHQRKEQNISYGIKRRKQFSTL